MRSICTAAIIFLAWGPSFESRANELAEIKAVPAKVILGALTFGQNSNCTTHFELRVEGIPSGYSLTHVDCSQAEGINLISEQESGNAVVLNLGVNVQTLSDGQPYGTFIKRLIRLETDCPNQPQFVVPVMGWLDVNHSSRNFNQYLFQGKPRWQGPWSTPNVAGAVLTTSALVLIGGAGWLERKLRAKRHFALILALCLAMTGMASVLWLLCSTYSREAWLAFFLASSAMVLFSAQVRRSASIALCAFIILLSSLPAGVQRVESYGNLGEDLSIANRLKLWTGAFQMMADHPLTGVGTGKFPDIFERDYQQFSHTARTSTAVNDFLTIGVENGVIVLSLLLGLLLFLLAWSLRLCLETGSLPLMVLTAMFLAILTTSCFSTLWVVPDYRWIAGVTAGGLFWIAIINEFRKREFKSFAYWVLQHALKWTLVTSAVLLVLSFVSLCFLPTRSYSREIMTEDSRSMRYDETEPRWTSPKGTILYLANLSDEAKLAHSTLRPIAAMGWRVIPVSSDADPAWVRDLITAISQDSSAGNIFVAGEADGAKLAWRIAAEESPRIVKAGGGFDFLSSDMDDPNRGSVPSQPFLVYQSLYGDGASSNPAILARKQIGFKGLPLTVVLSNETASHFSGAWINFLTTLSNFFDHESQLR